MTVDEQMDALNPEHERRMALLPDIIRDHPARMAEIERHYAARKAIRDADYAQWNHRFWVRLSVGIIAGIALLVWLAHLDVAGHEACRASCAPVVGVITDGACYCNMALHVPEAKQ